MTFLKDSRKGKLFKSTASGRFFHLPLKVIAIFPLAFLCYKKNDDDDDDDDNSDFISVYRKIAEENPSANSGLLKYLKYKVKY